MTILSSDTICQLNQLFSNSEAARLSMYDLFLSIIWLTDTLKRFNDHRKLGS